LFSIDAIKVKAYRKAAKRHIPTLLPLLTQSERYRGVTGSHLNYWDFHFFYVEPLQQNSGILFSLCFDLVLTGTTTSLFPNILTKKILI